MSLGTVARACLSSYGNSGGLSALAGSAVGIFRRAYLGISPHLILETTCTAPRGVAGSWANVIATPLTYLSGMSFVTIQAFHDWGYLDRVNQQADADHQSSRRAQGTVHCVKAGIYGLASCVTNVFAGQLLLGMCVSEVSSGLAQFGRIGLAKTVLVLSSAGFALLNVGFFAHSTEKCQDVHTTWANILIWGPMVACACTAVNTTLSPLYGRTAKIDLKSSNDSPNEPPVNRPVAGPDVRLDDPKPVPKNNFAERLEEFVFPSIPEHHDLRIGQNETGNVVWTIVDPKNGGKSEPPAHLFPNIKLPNRWQEGWEIKVTKKQGQPGYAFTLVTPQATGENQAEVDPKVLEAFFEEILSSLNKEVIDPKVAEFEQLLDPRNKWTQDRKCIVIQRGKQALPTWSIHHESNNRLSAMEKEDIPKVALDISHSILSNVALEIRYDATWNRYIYTLRNIYNGEEVFIRNCRPGCNDGLIQIRKPLESKEIGLFETRQPFSDIEKVLAKECGGLSFPLRLRKVRGAKLSLEQRDISKVDGTLSFTAIPDGQGPSGVFSSNSLFFNEFDAAIYKGAYGHYFCRAYAPRICTALDNFYSFEENEVTYEPRPIAKQ